MATLFLLRTDDSVFGLVSLAVKAQCVRFSKSVENPGHEFGTLFPDASCHVPALLEPCPEVEHILRSLAPTSLCVRHCGYSVELHHYLHIVKLTSLYATKSVKFRAVSSMNASAQYSRRNAAVRNNMMK